MRSAGRQALWPVVFADPASAVEREIERQRALAQSVLDQERDQLRADQDAFDAAVRGRRTQLAERIERRAASWDRRSVPPNALNGALAFYEKQFPWLTELRDLEAEETGRIMDQKADGTPFKGVRKEH